MQFFSDKNEELTEKSMHLVIYRQFYNHIPEPLNTSKVSYWEPSIKYKDDTSDQAGLK